MDTEIKSVPSAAQALALTSAWSWGVPLAAAGMLAVVLASGANSAVFLWLNHAAQILPALWWSHLTILGDASLGLLLMLPLLGRRPELAWQFLLAALFATLWSHGMKEIFSSLRPPAVLPADSFRLIGPLLEHNSFPSGHTTTAFVLAGLVAMQAWERHIKLAMLLLAALIGLSRIACGVHWPLDVLGGMFGGWLSAVAGVLLARHWRAGLNVRFQQVLALILLATALWTLFSYDNGLPGTWLFQTVFCLLCLAASLKGLARLFGIAR